MLKIAHPQTGAPMCVPAYEGDAALLREEATSKDLAA
jgi:iron complex transport system ATP-binding protein